jgi:formate dehydrogenase assembly factor FdhD
MASEQYITVSEFSKRANVTRQYVYQQLDKKLKEFVKVVDNKKMLNIKGLELFNQGENCKVVEQQFSQQLNNQVDSLNKQIESLLDQLKAKDEQIKDLSTMVKQEQELLSQEQSLHLATQQKLLLLEQKQEHQEQPKEEDAQLDQPVESAKKQWWKFWK